MEELCQIEPSDMMMDSIMKKAQEAQEEKQKSSLSTPIIGSSKRKPQCDCPRKHEVVEEEKALSSMPIPTPAKRKRGRPPIIGFFIFQPFWIV